jgi:hypothetical protein
MTVQFLDELPTSNRTVEQKPEVVEFCNALKQNPGKWAQFPLERKTKPKLGDGFEVARRNGVLYARYDDTVSI